MANGRKKDEKQPADAFDHLPEDMPGQMEELGQDEKPNADRQAAFEELQPAEKPPSGNKGLQDLPEGSSRKPGDTLKIKYFRVANAVYDYIYYVGLQLLRSIFKKRRKFKSQFAVWIKGFRRGFIGLGRRLRHIIWHWWYELTKPFREMRTRRKEFQRQLKTAKQRGGGMRASLWMGMLGFWISRLFRILCTLFNYAAPIAAIVFLVACIRFFTSLPLALKVTYNGTELGYITDESVFNQAENEMKGRIINEVYIRPADIVPEFQLTPWNEEEGRLLNEDDILSVDDLTNLLIMTSGNELEEADGLYIQNRFVSAVTDGEGLLDYLDGMLKEYETGEEDEVIQFVKKIQLKTGLYPLSSVEPLADVIEKISGEERGEQYYTVIEGDTPIRIAAKNGITFDELKSMNPEVDVSLFPGDQLLISRSVPYLGIQVTKQEEYEEEIPYQIEQQTNPNEDIGWTQTLRQGEEGIRRVVAEVVMIDGIEVERNIVEREVIKQPVTQILEVGGNQPLQFIPTDSTGSLPSGTWGWPAAGGSITTPWMGYYGHTGSDISWSGCYGTPVYASQAGTVVVTRYSTWGYGYYVILDHGGGYQTLYAHMSRIDVVPGQQVAQGEQLGLIGRTGNTTGPHLHFEIRVNGVPTNAAPYLYG